MGYYSNFEFELNGAVIDNPKELVDEINNENIFQVWKEPETKLIFENKELIDIERDDGYYDKFYDSEKFADILSKHLVSGKINIYFKGEDGDEWSYTIYPQYVLDKRVEEVTPFDIEKIMKLKPKIKTPILNDINAFLKEEKEKINAIEKAIELGAGEDKYVVEIPTEETRRVVYNNLIYCKTKEDAENLKKYIKENGLVGISIDDVEDIDVIDSWNEEYFANEIEIREI